MILRKRKNLIVSNNRLSLSSCIGFRRSFIAVSSMKKIRINELARELEVKPGVILDLLPELGVQEKKTHSSSVDEETAIILRQRLAGSGERFERSNGHVSDGEQDE